MYILAEGDASHVTFCISITTIEIKQSLQFQELKKKILSGEAF
jgi:hypothetical protein